MTINYKIGNVTGTAILYTNKNGNEYNEPIADNEKLLATQEKKQASLFKILNMKKLSATYKIQ